MALYKKIAFGSDGLVGIWKITESLSELESIITLDNDEMDVFNQFRFEARKKEWLAVRCLLTQLLGHYVPIRYLPSGKPCIEGGYISISHTKGYVGVSLSKEPTAIDLEYPSNRVVPLAHRFVSEKEMLMVGEQDKALKMLLIWSGKETLFKLYDREGVIFNTELFIQNLSLAEQGTMKGGICKDGYQNERELFFQLSDDLILVYC